MGWFENQIADRKEADQQLLEDSFARVAGVVLGWRTAEKFQDDRIFSKNAIDDILKYYHYRSADVPDEVKTTEDQLDYCLRPHGVMRRTVRLEKGWYRDAYGPILATRREDGRPLALLPDRLGGYAYADPDTGKRIRLNRKTETLFESEAICFYRPLPQKKLGIPDLMMYMKRCVSLNDIVLMVLSTLAVTLVGMMMPRITKALTGPVLESRSTHVLAGLTVCLVCTAFSSQLLGSVSSMVSKRLTTKTSLGVQASMMMRLMSLPVGFFRQYSAGELKSRSSSVNELCTLLMGMVMTSSLTSVTSLLYVTQIFSFAPALVVPSLLIITVTLGFGAVSTGMQIGINRKKMDLSAKESGMAYSMITGVQKIRLSGAEKRIFAKWMNLYADNAELSYNPPMFIRINGVINTAIGLFSTIILYYLAVQSRMDPSSYFAFTAAYGALLGSFSALADIALDAARIRPILEMAEPFLKTEPETAGNREIVTGISGRVELEHVYFRYRENTEYILKDMSLKIRAGEYVAIVGKTGCGKSTLMRLLLGFEKPEKGAVYYDGKNISSLDPVSLRRKIGSVMQTSGLFQGDIYSNIVITAPELTMDDAWEAAEKAGIADDIREMPMKMHTMISEGQGGISGGQRQRIMIARAIAPRPKLLLFDEATSALDNKTQRQVSEALDAMGCTRIVIAHRLSTIRNCDRILVMDQGRIVEDGTYEELIRQGGFFSELVERQRLGPDPKAVT